jgi:hypothetical protein
MPDPERLGGIGWARRTKGALTGAERRRLYRAVARGQAEIAAGRLKLALGRAPRAADQVPDPPDSAFARDVQEACDEQPPAIVAHSYRTWAFGHALAALDGHQLDPEQFWCASLLHDAGLAEPVPGEDFTLRSAAAAIARADRHGHDGEPIADAITVHATAGIDPERDGALGAYVQAGAMLDLGGLRIWDASPQMLREVARRHPPPGDMIPFVRDEARAVPNGRFALMARCGMLLAMRASPLRPKAAPST